MLNFLVEHHWQIMYALGGLLTCLNFFIKIALYIHPVADWVGIAERRPRIAAVARLMMALGINPVSVVQALVDFIRNEASPGTLADAKAIATSASRPLIAPRKATSVIQLSDSLRPNATQNGKLS